MSPEIITTQVMKEGADISAHGIELEALRILAEGAAQPEIQYGGEVSLAGAMHALNVKSNDDVFSRTLHESAGSLGLDLQEIKRDKDWVKSSIDAIEKKQVETLGLATEFLRTILQEDNRRNFINGNCDWQEFDFEEARILIEIIVENNGKIDLDDPETYKQIGHEIHEAYISRSRKKEGGRIEPGLEKPFSELSIEQREKVMNKMRLALGVFGLSSLDFSSQQKNENSIEEDMENIDHTTEGSKIAKNIIGISEAGRGERGWGRALIASRLGVIVLLMAKGGSYLTEKVTDSVNLLQDKDLNQLDGAWFTPAVVGGYALSRVCRFMRNSNRELGKGRKEIFLEEHGDVAAGAIKTLEDFHANKKRLGDMDRADYSTVPTENFLHMVKPTIPRGKF